mgnify:CR=1 FL=1
MFNTYEAVLDTVQTAKKQAVKTFVRNEAIAETLTKWVETEATIAKDLAKLGTETATTIGQEMLKSAQDAAKADHVKTATDFYSNFWKEAFKSVTPAKSK